MCSSNGSTLCTSTDCSTCSLRRMSKELIEESWCYNLNERDPLTIPSGSSKFQYWFRCTNPDCRHLLLISPKKMKNNQACKYCNNYYLCGECDSCISKSLKSMEDHLVIERHPGVNLSTIHKGTCNDKYWFRCRDCNHEYDIEPKYFNEGHSCRYCSSSTDDLCSNPSCSICLDHSIKSVTGDDFWSYEKNGDSDPRMIKKGSHKKKYWFICKCCSHVHLTTCKSFSNRKGCVYCLGSLICTDENCSICQSRSFSSHPMSTHWDHDKNDGLSPEDVRMQSMKKYWFICPCCNQSYCSNLHEIYRGSWCGCRKNKTEHKVVEWLRNEYPQYTIMTQYRLPSLQKRRFDIWIPELSLIIEIDGPQRFFQVHNWGDPEKTMKIDCMKMYRAKQSSLSIIRILQEDVWNDLIDWKRELSLYIRSYDIPSQTYICSRNQYDEHKEFMNYLLSL